MKQSVFSSPVTRRRVLQGTAAVAASSLLPSAKMFGQPGPTGVYCNIVAPAKGQSQGTLPPNFIGLSYEKDVFHYNLFSSGSTNLISMFQVLATGAGLGSTANVNGGILRLGGNSTDQVLWDNDPNAPAGQVNILCRNDILNLQAFLNALATTGTNPATYKVIYGLALGSVLGPAASIVYQQRGLPQSNLPTLANVTEEAACVSELLGEYLYGFEIGNECDAYSNSFWQEGGVINAYSYTVSNNEIVLTFNAAPINVSDGSGSTAATALNLTNFSGTSLKPSGCNPMTATIIKGGISGNTVTCTLKATYPPTTNLAESGITGYALASGGNVWKFNNFKAAWLEVYNSIVYGNPNGKGNPVLYPTTPSASFSGPAGSSHLTDFTIPFGEAFGPTGMNILTDLTQHYYPDGYVLPKGTCDMETYVPPPSGSLNLEEFCEWLISPSYPVGATPYLTGVAGYNYPDTNPLTDIGQCAFNNNPAINPNAPYYPYYPKFSGSPFLETTTTGGQGLHSPGIPFRVTECGPYDDGGVAGGTNAYASALWMIDFLMANASFNTAGVNFISSGGSYDGPITENHGQNVLATPSFYGAWLVAQIPTSAANPSILYSINQMSIKGDPENPNPWNLSVYPVFTSNKDMWIIVSNKEMASNSESMTNTVQSPGYLYTTNVPADISIQLELPYEYSSGTVIYLSQPTTGDTPPVLTQVTQGTPTQVTPVVIKGNGSQASFTYFGAGPNYTPYSNGMLNGTVTPAAPTINGYGVTVTVPSLTAALIHLTGNKTI